MPKCLTCGAPAPMIVVSALALTNAIRQFTDSFAPNSPSEDAVRYFIVGYFRRLGIEYMPDAP